MRPVGISAARALKQKNIAYDQFEADTAIGGNWRHGVYTTAHIVSSRKTTEFPDYPMPDYYPDFPSASQMLEYLNNYAEHYGLLQQIIFNTRVDYAGPGKDGLWELRFENGEPRLYEGVIICNGHHWHRRWPDYDGNFSGEFIHSKDYENPEQLKGKRVLIIGGGQLLVRYCDGGCPCKRLGSSQSEARLLVSTENLLRCAHCGIAHDVDARVAATDLFFDFAQDRSR